jgi:hypothetical protein
MAIPLPVFNKVASWWEAGTIPASDPPTAVDVPIQFYVRSQWLSYDTVGFENQNGMFPFVRFPKAKLVDLTVNPTRGSIWGIVDPDLGTIFYYRSRWWEFTHWGFPNEYISVQVEQCTSAGTVPDEDR